MASLDLGEMSDTSLMRTIISPSMHSSVLIRERYHVNSLLLFRGILSGISITDIVEK